MWHYRWMPKFSAEQEKAEKAKLWPATHTHDTCHRGQSARGATSVRARVSWLAGHQAL